MSRGSARRALLAATLCGALAAGASGCDVIEDVFGGGGAAEEDELQLNAITIESDHPEVPGSPSGAAVASNGELVRFIAIGHFLNLDEDNQQEDHPVTGSVLWTSSNPALAQPASDGRVIVTGTGTAAISARAPATGSLPEIVSNEIVLTVVSAGTAASSGS